MPKPLLRVVAVLLATCLTGDPVAVSASNLSRSPFPSHPSSSSERHFLSEAVVPRLIQGFREVWDKLAAKQAHAAAQLQPALPRPGGRNEFHEFLLQMANVKNRNAGGESAQGLNLSAFLKAIVLSLNYPDPIVVDVDETLYARNQLEDTKPVIVELIENAIDGSRVHDKRFGKSHLPAVHISAALVGLNEIEIHFTNRGNLPLDKLREEAKSQEIWKMLPYQREDSYPYHYLIGARMPTDEPMPFGRLADEEIDLLPDDILLFRIKGLTLRSEENLARIGMKKSELIGGVGLGLKMSWRTMQRIYPQGQITYALDRRDNEPLVTFSIRVPAAALADQEAIVRNIIRTNFGDLLQTIEKTVRAAVEEVLVRWRLEGQEGNWWTRSMLTAALSAVEGVTPEGIARLVERAFMGGSLPPDRKNILTVTPISIEDFRNRLADLSSITIVGEIALGHAATGKVQLLQSLLLSAPKLKRIVLVTKYPEFFNSLHLDPRIVSVRHAPAGIIARRRRGVFFEMQTDGQPPELVVNYPQLESEMWRRTAPISDEYDDGSGFIFKGWREWLRSLGFHLPPEDLPVLARVSIEPGVVLVNPHSHSNRKEFSSLQTAWIQSILMLIQQGKTVVLNAGEDRDQDATRIIAEAVRTSIGETPLFRIQKFDNVGDLVQFLANVEAVFTIDTGIAHLAQLYRLPQLVITTRGSPGWIPTDSGSNIHHFDSARFPANAEEAVRTLISLLQRASWEVTHVYYPIARDDIWVAARLLKEAFSRYWELHLSNEHFFVTEPATGPHQLFWRPRWASDNPVQVGDLNEYHRFQLKDRPWPYESGARVLVDVDTKMADFSLPPHRGGKAAVLVRHPGRSGGARDTRPLYSTVIPAMAIGDFLLVNDAMLPLSHLDISEIGMRLVNSNGHGLSVSSRTAMRRVKRSIFDWALYQKIRNLSAQEVARVLAQDFSAGVRMSSKLRQAG